MRGEPLLVHASCVAVAGRAVLIAGPSGSGKSDLALRLIDRGAALVSDDYTELRARGGQLLARAPDTIAGRIEMRGVGLVDLPAMVDVPVCLHVRAADAPERLPEAGTVELAGIALPSVAIAALEPSAPLKLEAALERFGLPL
ncbi:MAG TPA: HPr kinase/phosphatase C-terminal domain-containing protein [Allosphingosinicella sp.]|nr:HPr kinase/phosphatase C-terminal domain-containing protein [Allosphingosinicella sp.]